MFYLDGANIYIHRGDSASFDIVFGPVADVQTESIIPEEYAVIDSMMVPALGAEVNDTMLDISVSPSSFPVYPRSAIMVKDVYGINWVPEDGTPIRFSVKCDIGRFKPVIQKDYVVYNGFVSIDLLPIDTFALPFGEYVWDIRLSFDNADYVDWNTPISPFKFTVCDVVGNQTNLIR